MAPAKIRRTPYKDLLHPALQTRFTSTAGILLAIAFVESLIVGHWHSVFWALFPIGPAGIRVSLIFFCGLLVIVLRIAQYHVGYRTSNSGFQTFTQNAPTIQTLEAILSYTLSAWLFSQVYLCSASEDLNWIVVHTGDRARLNEKPVFLTTHFLVFGIVQGILHIFRDDDRLFLGAVKLDGTAAKQDGKTLWQRLVSEGPSLARLAAVQAGSVLLVDLVVYWAVLRSFAWRTALALFRPFYTLPKTNMVPATLPYSMWVLGPCAYTTFMLLVIWLAGNQMFSMFLVREPIKRGNPLTSESKDPNGSLLNGLKSRKLPIKCFAMWELALISRDFQIRRKAIYEDLDRKDGPMWSHVYSLSLDVLKSIETRIDSYGKPPPPPATTAVAAMPEPQPAFPRAKPPKTDPVLLSTPTRGTIRGEFEKAVDKAAVSPGSSLMLSPHARKQLAKAKATLQAIKHEATNTENPTNPVQLWTGKFLKSYFGAPFRQTFCRRLCAAVLGTPHAEPSLYINAISSLTRLAVSSLAEDNYGNVQRDVSSIIRTFTSVATKLEKFKADFPVHWTDPEGKRDCPEVDAITETLKEGLSQLIASFGPYARDLRLSFADMRHAREAAGVRSQEVPRPETQQVQ